MSEQETASEMPEADDQESIHIEPSPVEFQPAGFWRRLFAFIIDALVLAVGCFILSAVLTIVLPTLGLWGRLVGMVIGTLYFGVFSSSVTRVRTMGKYLLGLAVVDATGNALPLGRSLIRAVVLNLILLVNGWAIPFSQKYPIIIVLQTIVLFVGSLLMIYGLVFDRKTRRGLHDLLVDSYVVKVMPDLQMGQPVRPRVHRYVMLGIGIVGSLAIIILMAVSIGSVSALLGISRAPVSSEPSLYQTLADDPRFITVQIMPSVITQLSGGPGLASSGQSLDINLWYNGPCSPQNTDDCDAVADSVARTVFSKFPQARQLDTMRIYLTQATDLGWWRWSSSHTYWNSIKEWESRLDISP